MSRLATGAEIIKLARVLGVDAHELGYLSGTPAEQLRSLREAIYERLFNHDHKLFIRMAGIARWLPAWLMVIMARTLSVPLMTARMAGEIPARRAAYIGTHAPVDYLADVAAFMDPRVARDVVKFVDVDRVVQIAHETLRRKDLVTMGRFIDIMPDASLQAALEHVKDDAALLRICFFVESRNRLDHVLHLLPPDRLRGLLLHLDKGDTEIESGILSLLIHAGHTLRRELFAFLATEHQPLLDRLIEITQRDELWADLLPALRGLAPEVLRVLINRPALQTDPSIMQALVITAYKADLWTSLVPLLVHMEPATRTAMAAAAGDLPANSLQGMATAALMGEHWQPVLSVVAQMPEEKHRAFAVLASAYGEVDASLYRRLATAARESGITFSTT